MCLLDTINYLFYKVLFTIWYCQGMFVFYWCIPWSIYRPMKTCRAILSLAVVVPRWLLWTVSTYISGKSLDTCMKWRETSLGEPLCPWSSEQGGFLSCTVSGCMNLVVLYAQWSNFNMENRRHDLLWLCYGLLRSGGSLILSLFSQAKILHIIFLCYAACESLTDFSVIGL